MIRWHIIAGEYPPKRGGVADYTQIVADALYSAGDEVHVWTAGEEARVCSKSGVTVHRIASRFGARHLYTVGKAMKETGPGRVLVQYTPSSFGSRGMNVGFCLWLASKCSRPISVMFHEVAYPFRWNQPIRFNALAALNRIMAFLIARASSSVYVSTPAWERLLRPMLGSRVPVTWLPVPSNIPRSIHSLGAPATRALYAAPGELLVGHFGTYGSDVRESLQNLIPQILEACPRARVLLIGRDSDVFATELFRNDALGDRVRAAGYLPANELSQHLLGCDLMVQPLLGGVNARHSSVMAALAHGLAVVTTEGVLTEPLWKMCKAVATASVTDPEGLARTAISLLNDKVERTRLAAAGHALYDTLFDVRHSVKRLRAEASS